MSTFRPRPAQMGPFSARDCGSTFAMPCRRSAAVVAAPSPSRLPLAVRVLAHAPCCFSALPSSHASPRGPVSPSTPLCLLSSERRAQRQADREGPPEAASPRGRRRIPERREERAHQPPGGQAAVRQRAAAGRDATPPVRFAARRRPLLRAPAPPLRFHLPSQQPAALAAPPAGNRAAVDAHTPAPFDLKVWCS